MTFVSYAQNCEDVLLWRALGAVEHGCYIDVGAADPDEDNVTRAFYEAGWRGVNVEPMETFATRLHLRRPDDVNLSVAVGAEVGERVFYQIWAQPDETGEQKASGLSTLDSAIARRAGNMGWVVRETKVEVTTLAAICRDHTQGAIHILKVDAEGSEREVLSGADFTSFRPWIIVVEALHPDTLLPSHAEWEPILLAADYHFVWFDGLNRFYVAAERLASLGENFRTPLNLFDDFVRDNSGATTRLREARAAFAAEQAITARLRKQLERVADERDHAIAAKERQSVDFLQLAEEYDQQSIRILQQAANYERQLAETEAETSALSKTLAAARLELEVLEHCHVVTVGYLERLALELRWDQGPRALKAVLPVARLLRRLHGFVGGDPTHATVTQAAASVLMASAGTDSAPSMVFATESALDNWRRRFALLPYRAVRPIIRPLAWRLRTFLTAELQHELRQLRDAPRSPPEQSPAVDLSAFSEAAERLLLTLALEHQRSTDDDQSE
jgi:FkbM family methyltransferase